MAGAGRVGEQDRDLARVPVLDGLGVGVQVARLRERLGQPRQVRLEIVGDQHRHAGGLLDDVLEGLQLLVVDFLPGPLVVGVDRAAGQLPALHRLGPGAEGLDPGAGDVGVHVALHVVIEPARPRREVDVDGVDDRLVHAQPVHDRQADVGQQALDLGLGVGHGVHAVAVEPGAEPPLREAVVGAAEALAGVEEPGLAPEILQPVRRGGAGQVDPPRRLGVGDAAEGPRALGPLPEAEALELGALVGDHGSERPARAGGGQGLDQPGGVLVVRGEQPGVAFLQLTEQQAVPGLGVADDRCDLHAGEVVPLRRLGRPRRLRHPQGGEDDPRPAVLAELDGVQRRQGRRRLAGAHAGERRPALQLQLVLDDLELEVPRDEGLAHASSPLLRSARMVSSRWGYRIE